ncbi:MAG: poly(A) polymerase [Gallionellales bacterium RIFCSPLOWO2_12_FULL_57_18]|nr:MAG: poly(A) polymerase [Gallionellales bacterium RIFCSPLOWO2_12_FULL_57_18]OGS95038.1 MAG: poly(A) polymerase [Gallionellales bacterium RIFCSPLOWO2_02_FULL_57_47]OGT11625.1 MAG: poly(A) polymerase [Gallionellales bacterium RIFCSPHIGHO2_02_FULL_57_16]
MIRKFLKRVFRKSAKTRTVGNAQVIPFDLHGVAREQISYGAKKVTDGLQAKGYQAYVVGGAVRDLLLECTPKDFDIATDATPEEVRRVFRRSRIIGRRFQLVHAMFGEEVVEVSTFRSLIEAEDAQTDEHGRLLRDNQFGDQEQDAARRDFTANALFYDPATQEIVDYHGGYADTSNRLLRMIGDPEVRYREDPVRMLRAVRLSAKLGMQIDPATAAPIARMKDLLDNVPQARLLDEVLKMLLSGHSVECIQQLRKMNLHHGLLPLLDVILEQPIGEKFVMLALRNTDERLSQEKTVSPAFLFAALLWHEVLAAWNLLVQQGERPVGAMHTAMDEVLGKQKAQLAIPHRHDAVMKEIWLLQQRFEQRAGQRPFRLLEQPRFRAAFDFLLLRCASGEVDDELGLWWDEFQDASAERRAEMLQPEGAGDKKRRKRKPRKKPETAGATEASVSETAE